MDNARGDCQGRCEPSIGEDSDVHTHPDIAVVWKSGGFRTQQKTVSVKNTFNQP